VDAAAEVIGDLGFAGEGGEGGGRNGGTDGDADGAALFVDEFAGEQRGAETGMDEAGGLEASAIGAVEEEGDGGGAGAEKEAGGGGFPGRVFDTEAAGLEGGDFTGGEDDKEATGVEPGEALTEGLEVLAGGVGAAEGVDGDDVGSEFGDGGKERVGEEADVGPEAEEELSEERPFEEAEGVVGDDDDGAAGGDAVEVAGIGVEGDAERLEEWGKEGTAVGPGFGVGVEGLDAGEQEEAVEPGAGNGKGEAGEGGEIETGRRGRFEHIVLRGQRSQFGRVVLKDDANRAKYG
jgi:hypothetical protein